MKKLQKYFSDSFAELNKVTWLTTNQAVRTTMIVLGVCAVIGAFLVLVDLGFSELFTTLIN